MEHNQITIVDFLIPGDRFHKLNDKHKKVFVIVDHKIKRTHFQTYKHWCLPASVADQQPKPEVAERFVMAIKKDTKVVYLRSTEPIVL